MDASVIVAGAGPVGLTLAAELRLGGVDVIVVDALPAPSGESRGLGFTARTLEMFDQRGLLPRFGHIETSALGHFAGLRLDFSVLPGGHFGARGIPQARIEAVLAAWADELGADIRRGWTVRTAMDQGDWVEVDVETPHGRRVLRCLYLVGCDGGRSTVRKVGGFDFPGVDATIEMFLADVAGCNVSPRRLGERRPGGMVMSAPLGNGVDRIIVVERANRPRPRSAPPTFAVVADAWWRLTGEDISTGRPLWVSTFTDAARQVSEYRRGSVLLAGDAAHIHLPAGGQGLSVGVQDSMNLGWKLAATVRGRAPAGLLDSYHSERHPVGARLLTNTRAQGHLFQSGAEVDPLRRVFAELMKYPEVGRHLAGMVSGLDIRYDVGRGSHRLLGRRIPDARIETAGESDTVYRLLHPARGILLELDGMEGLRRAVAGWSDRVDTVAARHCQESSGSGLEGTSAVLVRPDGYVAWAAADVGTNAESMTRDLRTALHRWFGAPTAAPVPASLANA